MRNDQIFVLLLVVLLPMSGCMDAAVGDVEGTEDAESTTHSSQQHYRCEQLLQPNDQSTTSVLCCRSRL